MNINSISEHMRQLRRADVCFADKLRQVTGTLPSLDTVTSVRMVQALLDSALETQPSKEELYILCESSASCELLGEYLRGLFMQTVTDPQRIDMADRLEQVISYRIAERVAARAEHRLHHTIAEYLLRARN